MEIQHQEYLTFSKAATLMGCSRQYIYKLVAIGKLNASRISNRMAFIRRADIEQMLASNPYHRILPGSTSIPRKSASSSTSLKKKMREENNDEVLDFYSGEEVMTLFPKEFADTEIDTIKNFKVDARKSEIPINEPDGDNLSFHYPEDYQSKR